MRLIKDWNVRYATSLAAMTVFYFGFTGICAAAPTKVGVWTVGDTYKFHLKEERSPTPATDDKAIEIQQDIAVRVLPATNGEFELDWTASNTVVAPDPEPVRKNIPQLGDSILFEPGLTQKFALDDKGKFLRVVNMDEIGAAMRRGFDRNGEQPSAERFFAMITSRGAIEGAVDKLQIWLLNAAADIANEGKSENPVLWPGTTTQIGSMSIEVIDTGSAQGPRHTRTSRHMGKQFANEATITLLKKFGVPDNQLGQFDGDIIESVDVFVDPITHDPQRLSYKTTVDFKDHDFTMTCDLTRIESQ